MCHTISVHSVSYKIKYLFSNVNMYTKNILKGHFSEDNISDFFSRVWKYEINDDITYTITVYK